MSKTKWIGIGKIGQVDHQTVIIGIIVIKRVYLSI